MFTKKYPDQIFTIEKIEKSSTEYTQVLYGTNYGIYYFLAEDLELVENEPINNSENLKFDFYGEDIEPIPYTPKKKSKKKVIKSKEEKGENHVNYNNIRQ